MSTKVSVSSLCALNAVAVTKGDDTVVNFCGLYVGVGGDVVVKTQNAVAVTFKNVPTGTFIPVNVNRVMAATTATDIVGLSGPAQ